MHAGLLASGVAAKHSNHWHLEVEWIVIPVFTVVK